MQQAAKDFSTVFSGYRVYLLVLPAASLAADAFATTTTAIPQLTADATKAQGYVNPGNQAQLQPLLADLNTQIGVATSATNGLASAVLAFTPAQLNANRNLLSSPRSSAQAARGALQKGRSDLRQIRTILRAPPAGRPAEPGGASRPIDGTLARARTAPTGGCRHGHDGTDGGRRLRRRSRPGRAHRGAATHGGRVLRRRARGPRPRRRPGVDPDDRGGRAGRHGRRASSVRATTTCTRWPRRWVSPPSSTFVDGDNVLATGGKVRRYRGDIPRISPVALASAGQAIARMSAMAKRVPVDAPWDATARRAWDAVSVRSLAHARPRPDQTGPRPRGGHGARLLRLRPLRGVTSQLALPGRARRAASRRS